MAKRNMKIHVSSVFINLLFIAISAACILPILLILAISMTDAESIYKYGYGLIPKVFSCKAYTYIFKDLWLILNSYSVSIRVVVIGGTLSLIITSMLAYPLSRKDYKLKKPIFLLVFFTIIFNGGLVPWYILIARYLNLKDTLWVLILPYLVSGWYVILMRTFFSGIPFEIIEAAQIDGSNEFKTYWRIVLPMSKPALATIGLLSVLKYWNDWWLGMLFIEKDSLVPLQYLLQRMMSDAIELARQALELHIVTDIKDYPSESAKMAMAVIAAGPMLFVFPFFQKYFVKGLTVGAVKG